METTNNYIPTNRYWWLMLIIGILSIACGIWVFRNPVESYFALAVYFSIMFIMYGIGEIVNAFAGRHFRNWGWGLAIGILDLIIGFGKSGLDSRYVTLFGWFHPYVRRYQFHRTILCHAIVSQSFLGMGIGRRYSHFNFRFSDYFPSPVWCV